MTTGAEFRDLPVIELDDREQELRREIFDLRMRLHSDASGLARYRQARKELARVLTVRHEKKHQEGVSE